MSELEQSATASSDLASDRTTDPLEDVIAPAREREGLPRTYRMRADAHYVDQLDARHDAPVIRLIPTRQIETTDVLLPAAAPAFARSIATHGILQPLLVRRSGSRFALIAGRKRLAAALMAGVTEVPCVVHAVDAAAAPALAEAENLRAAALDSIQPAPGESAGLHDALQSLESAVAEIVPVAALVRPAGGLAQRAAGDLVQAQAWRAAWLAGALAMTVPPYRAGGVRPLGAMLDRVKTGFDPESRLTRLQLDLAVAPDAARLPIDDRFAHVACAMIVLTLNWLRECEAPRVEMRVDVVSPGTIKFQVVQRAVSPPESAARWFRAADAVQPADPVSDVALRAAKTFAAQCDGTLEIVTIGQRGSVIQGVFATAIER